MKTFLMRKSGGHERGVGAVAIAVIDVGGRRLYSYELFLWLFGGGGGSGSCGGALFL